MIKNYIPIEDWVQIHTIFTLYTSEGLWGRVREDLSKYLSQVIGDLKEEQNRQEDGLTQQGRLHPIQ